jgi:transmembrane sensor
VNASSELMRTAAQWFVRARAADAQSEEFAAWLAWMEADPAHRRAFAQIQETWDIACASSSVLEVEVEKSVRRIKPLPRSQRFAVAAGILLAVVGAALGVRGWLTPPLAEERIATARGEHQTATLPDGSHIELGGLTGVAINFTQDRRLVVADEGEVFYKVNRDPRRPFVVKTGNVRVTAIGTAFSVRREGSIVSVAVEEGAVEIESESEGGIARRVRAGAGERIRLDSAQPKPAVRSTEPKSTAGWAPGKLRFEGEPLSVVVASLNRYSGREILLGDPTLANLQFSGTIFDDRIGQWLEGVQRLFPIELREVDSKHVVLERSR